jgi:hypothetical protein
LVTWQAPLEDRSSQSGWIDPSQWQPEVFAFQQNAALFGNNAPDPNLFVNPSSTSTTNLQYLIDTTGGPGHWAWFNYSIQNNQVDLDASYPKILDGSWFVLTGKSTPLNTTLTQLYLASQAQQVSRAGFGLSTKITRLNAGTTAYLDDFDLNSTEVLAQSEQLAAAEKPLLAPLYGSVVSLESVLTDLTPGQVMAVSGKRLKVQVTSLGTSNTPIPFTPTTPYLPGSGLPAFPSLVVGDILTLVDASGLPVSEGTPATAGMPDLGQWTNTSAATLPSTPPTLHLEDQGGRQGYASAYLYQFTPVPASSKDPTVQEIAVLNSTPNAVASDHDRTTLNFSSALNYCYDRTTTALNANVAPATHGASVSEILGSGDSSTPNQLFTLKQPPLTYIASPTTPSGRVSTLEVKVNGLPWTEVPTLFKQPGTAKVYVVLTDEAGNTDVVFGDGVEGALLPTGQNNVSATYRKGLGTVGNVAAGTLTTLIDRPLGVSGVTNPEAAAGGLDPQTVSDAKSNAPLTVLTLGRAVSVTDYQNFALGFAGIAKAQALWIPTGAGRGVYLTVAGAGGTTVPDSVKNNLVASLLNFGNPLIPIQLADYESVLFTLKASLVIAPSADPSAVTAAVQAALLGAFNFAQRSFGQPVGLDEVYAVIQGVAGVTASDIKLLYKDGDPEELNYILYASLPDATQSPIQKAQLLTLDPATLNLGVMS